MPISFKQTSMTFHLYNRELSYIIKILPEGIPVQLYFGAALPDRDDWDYLLEQARLAAQDRAGIRKACGWRLGGQVNGLYHYILTRDSRAYCRANRFQRWFISLRTWKNKLMHG